MYVCIPLYNISWGTACHVFHGFVQLQAPLPFPGPAPPLPKTAPTSSWWMQQLQRSLHRSLGHQPGDPKLENNEFWAARFGTSLRSCLVLTQLWDHLSTLHEAPSHHPNCAGHLPYLSISYIFFGNWITHFSYMSPICSSVFMMKSPWKIHENPTPWPPWPRRPKAQHLIDAQHEAHGQRPQDTVQDAGGVHQQQSAFQQDLVAGCRR